MDDIEGAFGDGVKLMKGNCLELMASIESSTIDLILCDLPYGITARNSWDSIIPLETLWAEYKRIIKENGVIALWGQMPFIAKLVSSNYKMFRYEWVVEKTAPTGHLNANKMPMRAHENVLIFYKKLPVYHPQFTHGHDRKVSSASSKRKCKISTNYNDYDLVSYDSTDRYPRDVLKFKWDKQKSKFHPTQKPVEACEYFIKTYTDPGMVVLDNCMGSGTTGVACRNLSRKFIGMELEEEYFNICKKRILGG